jgi:leader peptidase (prepilin peptidase)/N-methyltransferase
MEWSKAGVLFLLAGSVVSDVRKNSIPLWWLFGNGLLAVVVLYVSDAALSEALLGLLPGTILLILALVTGERIGKGDAFLVMVLGLYLGLWVCFSVLLLSLFLAAAFGVFRKAVRHVSMKRSVIFTPFLCMGFGIWWVCSLL